MKKVTALLALLLALTMTVPASAAWIADMTEDHWSYPYVEPLVELGIMDTDGQGNFEPDVPTTRAEFVYSLWKAFGAPEVEVENSFNDVHPASIYITAVEWALDCGITNGVGNNNFGPDQSLSREQAFTFLYRAMDYLGCAPTYDMGSEFYKQIAEFHDYEQISSWARYSIQLLMNEGIVEGSDTSYLWPARDLNNAATAAILFRSLAYMGVLETGRGDYFPDGGNGTVNAEDFYGVWEYVNTDVWLYIHGDGTYEFYNTEGLADAGTYYMDGETLHLSSGISFVQDPAGEAGWIMDNDDEYLFASELPSVG